MERTRATTPTAITTFLVALTFFAAWFRLPGLGEPSIWLDEAASHYQSSGSLWHLIETTANDNYPPLHNLILFGVIRFFGDSELALRLPTALMSVASVPLVYWLASRIGGAVAGIISACLLVVSPLNLIEAATARMYPLFLVTTLIYLHCGLSLLEKPGRMRAVLFGIATFLMLMSHFYAVFIFTSVSLVLAFLHWRRSKLGSVASRLWRRASIVAFVAFVPWFVLMVGRAGHVMGGGFWIGDSGNGAIGVVLDRVVTEPGAAVIALGLALLWLDRIWLPSGGDARVAMPHVHREFIIGVLAPTAFGPIAAGLFLSLVEPIMVPRYLIASGAAIFVLGGIMMSQARVGFAAALTLCIVVMVASWEQVSLTSENLRKNRTDWRQLERDISQRMQKEDLVLFVPSFQANPYGYYSGDGRTLARVSSQVISNRAVPEGTRRVWLVHDASAAELLSMKDILEASGMDEVEALNGYGPAEVLLFARGQ